MDRQIELCALSESQQLASDIALRARVDTVPLEERLFEEGEFKLRPLDSVRGRTIFVVQSLAGSAAVPVPQRLVRLLFLLFGLRDAGAARIIALVPYLSYARKDRRTQLRDPVNTRYVAQLLEATGVSGLVCLDVHNPLHWIIPSEFPSIIFRRYPCSSGTSRRRVVLGHAGRRVARTSAG